MRKEISKIVDYVKKVKKTKFVNFSIYESNEFLVISNGAIDEVIKHLSSFKSDLEIAVDKVNDKICRIVLSAKTESSRELIEEVEVIIEEN